MNSQQTCDDYILISKLADLSCNLTRDFFINQIMTDYPDLEDIEIRVFEVVTSAVRYLYDINAELKRRKNTYGGESKLHTVANDIYTFVQVLEGAEFH